MHEHANVLELWFMCLCVCKCVHICMWCVRQRVCMCVRAACVSVSLRGGQLSPSLLVDFTEVQVRVGAVGMGR